MLPFEWIRLIIFLLPLFVQRKCQKYWPEEQKEPFVYFPMTVRLKEVREYADYEVRDLVLEKVCLS